MKNRLGVDKLDRDQRESAEDLRRRIYPDRFPPREIMNTLVHDATYPCFARSSVRFEIYAASHRELCSLEYKDGKTAHRLSELLVGDKRFPVIDKPRVRIRPEGYKLQIKEGSYTSKHDGLERKTVEIELIIPRVLAGDSRYSGGLRILCKSLDRRGRKADRLGPVLQDIVGGKVDIGTLDIRRIAKPGEKAITQLAIAYTAQTTPNESDNSSVVAMHRGVANAINYAIFKADGSVINRSIPGTFIVRLKQEFYARRGAIQKDTAWLSKRKRRRAMRNLSEKEAAATDYAIKRITAQVFNDISSHGDPSLIISDDFASQMNVSDRGIEWGLKPYIRNFPMGKLREAMHVWASTRAQVAFQLVPSQYISKTCPACGKESDNHKIERPQLSKDYACGVCDKEVNWNNQDSSRYGRFECAYCDFSDGLERVSVYNVFFKGKAPNKLKKLVRDELTKIAKMRRRMLDNEGTRREVDSQASARSKTGQRNTKSKKG